MRCLKIAIDCDDVLVESAKNIVDNYNKTYKTRVNLGQLYSDAPDIWGVDEISIAIDRINRYLLTEDYFRLTPSPDAISSVFSLAKRHELHLVTARGHLLEEMTRQMINQYFNGCFTSLEFTNFFDNSKTRTKGEVCQNLGVDLIIDDHLNHINSALQSSDSITGIVFGNYPWNRVKTTDKRILWAETWSEVGLIIEGIADGRI